MQEVTPFYPIHLDSLVSDSTLEFNLYIKTNDEKCILFRERSLEFGERHRRKLLENQVHTLYLRQSDQKSYGRYLSHYQFLLELDSDVAGQSNCKHTDFHGMSGGFSKASCNIPLETE